MFNPPTEFFQPTQMAYYAKAPYGWSRCPLDYSVYCQRDALGRNLVVPGIYATCEQAPKRKFPDYQLKFSKVVIEKWFENHLSIFNDVRKLRDAEFKNLTHDLRAISTEIYHNALAVRDQIEGVVLFRAKDQIELIINAQQMMSLRLDIIDYDSGLSSGRPKENISAWPKVDKVVRCFSGKFKSRRMTCKLEGKPRDYIYGPPIFEIVPFVIIENALKYAPFASELTIRFEEKESETIIRFDSFGPKITTKEKDKIFEKSYRGEAVKTSQKGGSGIGLFAAKTIVETHFGGKIFVNQLEDKKSFESQDYWPTRFTLILPSRVEPDRQKFSRS